MTKLNERILNDSLVLESDASKLPKGILARVRRTVCELGKKNANGRVYGREVWERVIADEDFQRRMKNRQILGEMEHPKETQLKLDKDRTSHIISDMFIDDSSNTVKADFDILPTEAGKFIHILHEAGVQVPASTRAEGELEEAVDEDGNKYSRVKPSSYRFVCIDHTGDPSASNTEPESIINAVRTNYENKSISKNVACALLEKVGTDEARKLRESIEVDLQHEGCTCPSDGKKCSSGCSKAQKSFPSIEGSFFESVEAKVEEGGKVLMLGSFSMTELDFISPEKFSQLMASVKDSNKVSLKQGQKGYLINGVEVIPFADLADGVSAEFAYYVQGIKDAQAKGYSLGESLKQEESRLDKFYKLQERIKSGQVTAQLDKDRECLRVEDKEGNVVDEVHLWYIASKANERDGFVDWYDMKTDFQNDKLSLLDREGAPLRSYKISELAEWWKVADRVLQEHSIDTSKVIDTAKIQVLEQEVLSLSTRNKELSERYGQDVSSLTQKLASKEQEALRLQEKIKQLEENHLSESKEHSSLVESVKSSESKVQSLMADLKAKSQGQLVLEQKNEKLERSLAESQQKVGQLEAKLPQALLEKYLEVRLKFSGLKVSEASLALLKGCTSEAQVEQQLSELVEATRLYAIHSMVPTDGNFTVSKGSQPAVNAERLKIEKNVGAAFGYTD